MGAHTLSFIDTFQTDPLWTAEYDDVELVAGLMAAGVSLVHELNQGQRRTQYTVESTIDLSEFIVHSDTKEDDLGKYSCGALMPGEYGVWLRGSHVGRYHLYRFRKASFMQGLVSMFTGFSVDFRDYLWGLPFDSNLKKLVLSGYIMTSDEMAIDTPDLDDVDLEEADDENIIEPLTKDYGEYRD